MCVCVCVRVCVISLVYFVLVPLCVSAWMTDASFFLSFSSLFRLPLNYRRGDESSSRFPMSIHRDAIFAFTFNTENNLLTCDSFGLKDRERQREMVGMGERQ